MTEKVKRAGFFGVVVPLGCGLFMVLVVFLPFVLLTLLALQAGLPAKGVWVMVAVMAVALDVVAIFKLNEGDVLTRNRGRWLALILLVPYIGSLAYLVADYRKP